MYVNVTNNIVKPELKGFFFLSKTKGLPLELYNVISSNARHQCLKLMLDQAEMKMNPHLPTDIIVCK